MRLLLATAISLTCALPASAQTYQRTDHPGFEALRFVFRAQNLPLKDNPSCQDLVTSVEAPTLGDWMGWVFSQLEPVEGLSGIDAKCEGPADKLQCSVNARRRAGEEVWQWGVEFTANGSTGDIDPATLKCNMAG